MLQPQIVEKPALTVVGVGSPFIHALSPDSNAKQVIGPLWDRLMGYLADIPSRSGHMMYGIIYGLPEAQRSHRDELHYIAGVPVSGVADLPAGLTSYSVPAATFAVFTHRGPVHTIARTVTEAYRGWLPQSGYEHAEIADVELYDDRFCVDGPESEMEYWIPVIRK